MILSVNCCCPLCRLITLVTWRARLALVVREWGNDGSCWRKVIGTSLQWTQVAEFAFVSFAELLEAAAVVAAASFWWFNTSCAIRGFKFVGMLIGNWFIAGPLITFVFDCMLLRAGRLVSLLLISFAKSSLYFRLSDSVSSWLRWKFT